MANGLSTLNRARYAGLDFDTHNDDLRSRLQVKFAADFNDFAVSSLGIMLLDLTAFGLDTLSFYLDRRATDTFLATARTRGSVSRLSRQLGYKMGGAVSSSVDLSVNIPQVFSFDVLLPEGFQLEGPNDLIFEVARDVLFTVSEQGPNKTPKIVPAFEGETIEESFTSDGSPAQVFELRRVPDEKFVVQGSVAVTVDGSEFDVVDFLEFGETDQVEIGFNDEPPTVRFGDGVSGNVPTNGASIVVSYVASRGLEGQEAAAGTVTSVVDPLVSNFQEIPLTVTNEQAAVGGDNRESLSSAKANAPKVFKSREVAVTSQDYEALAGSYADPLFGRVAVAKALSTKTARTDLTVQNELTAISNEVTSLNSSLSSIKTAITSSEDQIATDVTTIQSELSSIAGHLSDIEANLSTILSNGRSIKNKSGEVSTDASDIQQHVVDGKAEVDASSASSSEKSDIKAFFDLIDSEASNIITAADSNIKSSAETVVSETGAAQDSVSQVGTDLVTSGTDLNQTDAAVSSISTEQASIETQAVSIDTVNQSLQDQLDSSTEKINEHLDRVLSEDCQANLVTVPILTKDAGGFYVAPSIGLVESLQSFLRERKEVTQVVSVTSGESFLVEAVITARVGVRAGFSLVVVRTSVEAVIEGVLRDRQFGASLFESDLDTQILAVEGAAFANVRIQGHLDTDGVTTVTSKLDSDNNLIIEESEVVTRGSITVTTEQAPTT